MAEQNRNSTATGASADPPVRRRRRSRAAVEARIRNAAQALFSERGYAGSTTSEIARRADVSESLIFRYFGDKSGLFDQVIAAPLNRMMGDLEARYAEDAHVGWDPADNEGFVRETFGMFCRNEALLRSLLFSGDTKEPDGKRTSLEDYLVHSSRYLERLYADRGIEPGIDLDLAARLAFGMIAASVLLRDLCFPDKAPCEEELLGTLQVMIGKGLAPPPAADTNRGPNP